MYFPVTWLSCDSWRTSIVCLCACCIAPTEPFPDSVVEALLVEGNTRLVVTWDTFAPSSGPPLPAATSYLVQVECQAMGEANGQSMNVIVNGTESHAVIALHDANTYQVSDVIHCVSSYQGSIWIKACLVLVPGLEGDCSIIVQSSYQIKTFEEIARFWLLKKYWKFMMSAGSCRCCSKELKYW